MRKLNVSRFFAFAACSLLFMACAGPRKYLAVEGKGKIALATFYLNKSIMETGAEKDSGPGLFQKKETYYQHHQEAVDAMWAQLTDSIGGAFGNAEFLPFGEVFASKGYAELTTYAPIKMFGLQMIPGDDKVYPKACKYVSPYDKKILAALFDSLKVDYLLIFDNDAHARFTGTDAKIVDVGFRNGRIALTVNLMLYHKADGLVWSMRRDVVGDTAKGQEFSLFELGTRFGVYKNLDLGFKYTLIGALNVDAKYQFLGCDSGSRFQMSSGLKGGYANLEGKVNGENVDIPVTDLILPVYATFAPVSWFGLTAAPEFCYRISDNKLEYPGGPIVGSNFDIHLGGKYGVIGEFGYHRHLSNSYSLMNYGVMVFAPVEFSNLWGGLRL